MPVHADATTEKRHAIIEEPGGRSAQHERVDRPCVLAVEGNDERAFLIKLLAKLGLEDRVYIRVFGRRSKLPKSLRMLVESPGFWENARSLGIVMDAEEAPELSYKSVCGALQSAKLSASREELVPVPGPPEVDILILPGDDRPGSIETVCLDSVEETHIISCVNGFSECVEKEWTQEMARQHGQDEDSEKRKPTAAKLHKMRAHAFLSTIYEKPEIRLGEAAGKGCGWNLDHHAFDKLRDFLTNLCSVVSAPD